MEQFKRKKVKSSSGFLLFLLSEFSQIQPFATVPHSMLYYYAVINSLTEK